MYFETNHFLYVYSALGTLKILLYIYLNSIAGVAHTTNELASKDNHLPVNQVLFWIEMRFFNYKSNTRIERIVSEWVRFQKHHTSYFHHRSEIECAFACLLLNCLKLKSMDFPRAYSFCYDACIVQSTHHLMQRHPMISNSGSHIWIVVDKSTIDQDVCPRLAFYLCT